MAGIQFLRQRWHARIEEDPLDLSFTRQTFGPNGAGGEKVTGTTTVTYRCSLTQDTQGLAQAGILPDAGPVAYSNAWALLAPWNAVFDASPDDHDEFDVAGFGHFIVMEARPMKAHGGVFGQIVRLSRES
jgi:hypothetical protein